MHLLLGDWFFWGFVLLLVGFGLGVGGEGFFGDSGQGRWCFLVSWLVGISYFTITMTYEILGFLHGAGVDVMVSS